MSTTQRKTKPIPRKQSQKPVVSDVSEPLVRPESVKSERMGRIVPTEINSRFNCDDYIRERMWEPLKNPLLYNNIRIILPNFIYRRREGNICFKLDGYEMEFGGLNEFVLPIVKMENEFETFFDSKNGSTFTTKIYYQLQEIEDNRGLICSMFVLKNMPIYRDEYSYIGKMIEYDILGINPYKRYELTDIQTELDRKIKYRKQRMEI